jgi:hypothetical protein
MNYGFQVLLLPRQLADHLGVVHDVAEPELPTESPANQTGSGYSP